MLRQHHSTASGLHPQGSLDLSCIVSSLVLEVGAEPNDWSLQTSVGSLQSGRAPFDDATPDL